MVSYRDMVWAKRAFNLRYGACDRPYADHFETGFCAGYSDVCNGGDGYVPAMPPVDYRSYEYQSGEGVQCVNAWFEGYPAGVAAARQEKVGNYNNVLISKMINSAVAQENAEHVLPGDVPVVNSNYGQPPIPSQPVSVGQPPAFPHAPYSNPPSEHYNAPPMNPIGFAHPVDNQTNSYTIPSGPNVVGSGIVNQRNQPLRPISPGEF